MQAVILSIGDELVLGQNIDTNSAYLSQYLTSRGIATLYHQSVADDEPAIAKAISQAASTVELVIITGGIGPTDDDLTRQSLAAAMGVELIEHAPTLEAMAARFANLGRTMPPRNRVQALHPKGSQVIPNPWGTAPGICAKLHKATIYVMPGVPSEMKNIFMNSIAPQIDQLTGDRQVILTHKINTFGLGESTVAQKLGPLMDRSRNPKVGTTVSDAIVSIRVRAEFDTQEQSQSQLDDTLSKIRSLMGASVFGDNDDNLSQAVVQQLLAKKFTLATAESCTAGMIAKRITDVPGSSAAYQGGWVTYTNEMKMSQLGVSQQTLDEHGAVSEPVARAMAAGALDKARADVAVSVTGIAGPGGGSDDKPVGTVWIGLAMRDAKTRDIHTDTWCFVFTGTRQDVRDRAAKSAMQLLRYKLMGIDPGQMIWLKAAPTR